MRVHHKDILIMCHPEKIFVNESNNIKGHFILNTHLNELNHFLKAMDPTISNISKNDSIYTSNVLNLPTNTVLNRNQVHKAHYQMSFFEPENLPSLLIPPNEPEPLFSDTFFHHFRKEIRKKENEIRRRRRGGEEYTEEEYNEEWEIYFNELLNSLKYNHPIRKDFRRRLKEHEKYNREMKLFDTIPYNKRNRAYNILRGNAKIRTSNEVINIVNNNEIPYLIKNGMKIAKGIKRDLLFQAFDIIIAPDCDGMIIHYDLQQFIECIVNIVNYLLKDHGILLISKVISLNYTRITEDEWRNIILDYIQSLRNRDLNQYSYRIQLNNENIYGYGKILCIQKIPLENIQYNIGNMYYS